MLTEEQEDQRVLVVVPPVLPPADGRGDRVDRPVLADEDLPDPLLQGVAPPLLPLALLALPALLLQTLGLRGTRRAVFECPECCRR